MRTLSTSKTLQTWYVTNNLTRSEYLEAQLVSLTRTPPKRNLRNHKKIENPTHIPSEQKTKSRKDEVWDGWT
jgi:hypothetical protein